MNMKKFVAESMREALSEVKKELGENAVILKTRKLPGTGFPFSGTSIEVTAAIDDESVAKSAFNPITVGKPGVYGRPRPSCIIDSSEQVEIRPWTPPVISRSGRSAVSDKDDARYAEIREDIRNLSAMVKSVITSVREKSPKSADSGEFTGGWAVLYKRLVDSEVKPAIAGSLIKNLQASGIISEALAESKMADLLSGNFTVAGPIKCKANGPVVAVFVGPTGSGKTTTIAKLAAHCRLSRKKKVSIITADTYRIAAIDQIRTFADIVKVGLHVVFSPEEAVAALAMCADDDLVFIDTAGRSQRNTEHMAELKDLLATIHPDEVHLVMSATTKDSDLIDTVNRYRDLGINRLLFTKLDETVHVGNVFNTVSTSGIPVSFFSQGQSVPDDIELAQPVSFVKRLWEGNP
ncbi:MAG: flagellar biosynthesis protein FlhF [Chitinispirillaceae bacterium]|jgi:flagellar biosynthesis protein FlhF|nr:flagellar biosynthesis protein FlhF [Chitinispirillaceae bacterium]